MGWFTNCGPSLICDIFLFPGILIGVAEPSAVSTIPRMPSYGKRKNASREAPYEVEAVGKSISGIADEYLSSVLSSDGSELQYANKPFTNVEKKRESTSIHQFLRWKPNADTALDKSKEKKHRKGNNGSLTQMFIDLGQRDFNSKSCSVCRMVYCPGLPSEERLHSRFHNSVVEGVLLSRWKNERTVKTFSDGGRIICVTATDEPAKKQKAEQVRRFVEQELGVAPDVGPATWDKSSMGGRPGVSSSVDSSRFNVNPKILEALSDEEEALDEKIHVRSSADNGCRAENLFTSNGAVESQAYLYISAERRVVGYLLAERIDRAHRILASDQAPSIPNTPAHSSHVASDNSVHGTPNIPPVSPLCTPPPRSRCRNDHVCASESPMDLDGRCNIVPNQHEEERDAHTKQTAEIDESPLKCIKSGTNDTKSSQISAWYMLLKRQPVGQPHVQGAKGKHMTKSPTYSSSETRFKPSTKSSNSPAPSSVSIVSSSTSSSPSSQGVDGGPLETSDSPLCMSTETEAAMLGISLIWVHGRHRRCGLGRRLLDAAREGFVYGYEIPKNQVALSLPTRDGSSLARSYFGHPQFLVYPPTTSSSSK